MLHLFKHSLLYSILRPTMSNTLNLKDGWNRDGILFEIILEEEVEEMVDFVTQYFLADEPLCRGVGLSVDTHIQNYYREIFRVVLPQHLSIKASDPNSKELFGVLISMKYDSDNLPADESGSDAENRHRHNKIISFLNQILDMKELEISFQQRGF